MRDLIEALEQRISKVETDCTLAVAALRERLAELKGRGLPPREARPPEPPRDAHDRCSRCHGAGGFPDGSFCSCSLGRDLEKDHRKAKQESTEEETARTLISNHRPACMRLPHGVRTARSA